MLPLQHNTRSFHFQVHNNNNNNNNNNSDDDDDALFELLLVLRQRWFRL